MTYNPVGGFADLDLGVPPIHPLPAHLTDLIFQAIGEASVQWQDIDKAGLFKAEQAAKVGEDLCRLVANAWGAADQDVRVQLRGAAYNLGRFKARVEPTEVGNDSWYFIEEAERYLNRALALVPELTK